MMIIIITIASDVEELKFVYKESGIYDLGSEELFK
jgi:hypothetical protein